MLLAAAAFLLVFFAVLVLAARPAVAPGLVLRGSHFLLTTGADQVTPQGKGGEGHWG